MKYEIKRQCYLLSLEGYEQKEIAKKLNISEATVSRAINSVVKGNDYQLAVKGCSKLLEEFVNYQEYAKKKLKELVEIKPLDNKERLAIIKMQTEIRKDLLTIGAQGEFIKGVQTIRKKIAELT